MFLPLSFLGRTLRSDAVAKNVVSQLIDSVRWREPQKILEAAIGQYAIEHFPNKSRSDASSASAIDNWRTLEAEDVAETQENQEEDESEWSKRVDKDHWLVVMRTDQILGKRPWVPQPSCEESFLIVYARGRRRGREIELERETIWRCMLERKLTRFLDTRMKSNSVEP